MHVTSSHLHNILLQNPVHIHFLRYVSHVILPVKFPNKNSAWISYLTLVRTTSASWFDRSNITC